MTESQPRAGDHWPQAVIFDLDGTLIDSAPDIAAAVNAALAERDIAIDSATARRFLGDGARKLIARVLTAHNCDVDEAELDRLTEIFTARYREQPCENSVVFEGALAALAELRAAGINLAVCTNKPQSIAERVIAHLELDRFIDVIVGAGTHALKPDPAPLLACLDALDSARDTAVYVGDMAVDREAGHAAGLPVLLAGFGYAATPVAQLGADSVFQHWAELGSAIAALRHND